MNGVAYNILDMFSNKLDNLSKSLVDIPTKLK